MIPRKKIRAYLSRIEAPLFDQSKAVELMRTLNKAYSGFVHGASPQLMDMYGGNPPKYHISGMLGTPRIKQHSDDLWNYFYRGIITFVVAAKAFGDDEIFSKIRDFSEYFQSLSGRRAY